MPESKGSHENGTENREKNDQTAARKQCELKSCRYPREEGSPLCLFHMSDKEKQEKDLWKKCMEKFYDTVGREGKRYSGFILKDVDLSGRKFDTLMDFSGTRFVGSVNFSTAHFNDVATFKGSVFSGNANFDEAVFGKEAVFTGSTFEKDANYRDTRFDGKGYFKRIRFQKANFHNTVFENKSIFSPKKADIENLIPTFVSADFTGAHFEKGGSFDHCIIDTADFEDSSIQNVSFREVNLDDVKFAGAQMEFAYLADSEWTVDLDRPHYRSVLDWFHVHDPRLVIREELEARYLGEDELEEKKIAYRRAENTYRRIKHSLANEGAYEKAGEFYIHEMRMKKERYAISSGIISKWNYFWNILYSWTCGYGERPKRVFLNAFLIIILFTFLYAAFNGISRSGVEDYDPSFKECLYFSVVTFTTLGYGDYAPKSSFQLVAVMEAFLGAFTIALFVLVFGRKVMR